jgi:protein disulfide-isomerase A1
MNKYLCLALLLVAVMADDYTIEEGVYVLGDSNFDKALSEFDFALVEFYAPWCGHCKRLAPEYAAAAQQLASSHPNIKLVKIDTTVEKELGSRFEIKGFPTLKFFIKGNSHPIDFEGGRTPPEIVNWLLKRTGPVSIEVSSVSEVEKHVGDSELVGVFFGSSSSSAYDNFKVVAASHDDIIFLNTDSDEIRQHYNVERDNFILFKKFDEGKNTFTGPWSVDNIKDFVSKHKFPLVALFDQKTAQRIFGEGHNALFVLTSDNDAGKKAEEAFKAAAEQLNGKISLSIARLHDQMGQRLAEYIGVTEAQTPTLRIVLPSQSMHKFSFEGEVTTEAILSFFDDWSNNRLKPFFKSDPIPETNDEPVKILVGKSFPDLVINSDDDVLVEFYAPWCGHCKQLAPIYDSLAKRVSKIPNLVIAKIDSTANEVEGVDIRGFPTIKLFPRGRKHSPIDFDGDRTEEGFVEFLKKNTRANFDDAAPTRDDEL